MLATALIVLLLNPPNVCFRLMIPWTQGCQIGSYCGCRTLILFIETALAILNAQCQCDIRSLYPDVWDPHLSHRDRGSGTMEGHYVLHCLRNGICSRNRIVYSSDWISHWLAVLPLAGSVEQAGCCWPIRGWNRYLLQQSDKCWVLLSSPVLCVSVCVCVCLCVCLSVCMCVCVCVCVQQCWWVIQLLLYLFHYVQHTFPYMHIHMHTKRHTRKHTRTPTHIVNKKKNERRKKEIN